MMNQPSVSHVTTNKQVLDITSFSPQSGTPSAKEKRYQTGKRRWRKQVRGQINFTCPTISCQMQYKSDVKGLTKSAVTFLQEHGHTSIVSLGCGEQLNRIDNHLRIMEELNLNYYVGIDYQPQIEPVFADLFMNFDGINALLTRYYGGKPNRFWELMRLFPCTFVEELAGIHCAAIVCQRVLPGCRWEEVIISMSPKLILQEDLHGCERQQLRGQHYVRNWSKIRLYALQPFRPWPIFPGEKNMVLWRSLDFGEDQEKNGKFRWLERLCESFIG